jgi:crossover junction endodeoxyribonuclease RuvC
MIHPQTILAIDPGIRELGYAVLRGHRIQTCGVRPLGLLPQPRRLPEARRLIRHWVGAHRPGTIVLERTTRNPETPSLHQLFRLARWTARLARTKRIHVATYAPQSVRKSVTGDGWASKRELAAVLASHYPALRVYLTQDRRWKERYFLNLFDALGLAVHHQNQQSSRSRRYG